MYTPNMLITTLFIIMNINRCAIGSTAHLLILHSPGDAHCNA